MADLRIRSRYVRDRLGSHPPSEDNLRLYQDLLRIEGLVADTPRHWTDGMALDSLRRRRPEAFAAIAGELDPALLHELEERDASAARESRRLRKENAARAAALLRALRAAAGAESN